MHATRIMMMVKSVTAYLDTTIRSAALQHEARQLIVYTSDTVVDWTLDCWQQTLGKKIMP